MSQISIRLTGNDKIRVGLRNVGQALPDLTKDQIRTGLQGAKFEASGGYTGGANYNVPERSGQSYQRTGSYGKGFDLIEEGMTFRLRTGAYDAKGRDHAEYVGGRADGSGQAWMHAGRWPVIAKVIEKWVRGMLAGLDAGIRNLLNREGIGL